MREMLPACKNSAQQDRSVYGGNLRIPLPLAGIHVSPVVEEPAVVRHFLPQKTKSVERASARFGVSHVAPLSADAQRRQPEARRGDTSQVAFVRLSHIAPISDQAGFWIRLFPEESKTGSFEFLEKGIIAGRKNRFNLA